MKKRSTNRPSSVEGDSHRTGADRSPRRTGGGKDRLFVTALARGLAILRTFESSSDRLGNADIARRAGLPKATGVAPHPHLDGSRLSLLFGRTWTVRAAIVTDGPGRGIFPRQFLSPQIAQPFLQGLADEVQCVVALFQRDGLDCMVVTLFTGVTQNIAVQLNVGAPAYRSVALSPDWR
jgi:hypothetical protein